MSLVAHSSVTALSASSACWCRCGLGWWAGLVGWADGLGWAGFGVQEVHARWSGLLAARCMIGGRCGADSSRKTSRL